jgi:hypothetical protein
MILKKLELRQGRELIPDLFVVYERKKQQRKYIFEKHNKNKKNMCQLFCTAENK